MKLIATKNMTYKTRRLQAGDGFETKNDTEGMVYVHLRKSAKKVEDGKSVELPPPVMPEEFKKVIEAQPAPREEASVSESGVLPATVPVVSRPVEHPPRQDHEQRELRAKAVRLGIAWDARWSVRRLQDEIKAVESKREQGR